MATGSQNLTTYYAKRIIGDTAAANAEQALLQIGTGVNTDTWILHKTGRATDYGIKYHYDYANSTVGDADQVQFVGKGSVTAWVQLDTGDLYVLGKVGIGYNPNTSGNDYKLYVNGTMYVADATTHAATVTFANNTLNAMGNDCYIGDQNSNGAICIKGITGNTNIRFIEKDGTAAGTLTWDGSAFTLSHQLTTSGGLISPWIELISATPYIDFHFGSSTADYTSRIIESSSGYLEITGKLGIGDSDTSYKLYVNGSTYSNGDIIAHSNFKTDRAGYGLFLIDGAAAEYAGIYDNGSNLWIGATSAGGQHHKGKLCLSAGHNGTEGNKSIYISIPTNGNNPTTYTSYPLVYKDATGTQYQGIYTDSNGKTIAMTYELKATVNSGTTTRMAYYSNTTTIDSADHIYVLNDYLISNSRNNQTVDIRANGLIIYGPTYGNTVSGDADGACRDLLSNKAGVFRFSDGGPQIIFNTSASFNAQAGALIYTDNDNAATGASFHFVTTESSNDNGGNLTVTAPRFRARAGLAIGQNSDNTTYKLYVNGTSYFNGNTTHNGIAYFANGTTYYINNSAVGYLSDIRADKTRLVGDWLGFYQNANAGGNRYGYIQTNANRMYFRKENGVSSYGFDFNSHLYTTGNYYAANNGPCLLFACQDIADVTNATNGLTANREQGMICYSKDYASWMGDFKQGYTQSNGQIWSRMYLRNYKTDGTQVNNYIYLYANKDGTTSYAVANKAAFRSAISAKAIQTAKTDPSASGSGITYIATISQNTEGVITATKSTVRDASASQSGVVSTGTQTFAGSKTFSSKITGSITGSCDGNAATATKFNSTRTIKLTGAVTGSATTDGGSGWEIATTKNHTHPISEVTWGGGQNLTCTPTAANQEYSIDLGNAYTGTYWHVWSAKNSKSILICYNDNMNVSVPNGTLSAKAFSGPLTGNVTGNCSGSSGSCTGNAATASKMGEAASWLYFHRSNEVNFGGTDSSNTAIYFGYRATDSRSKPADYYFGSGNGTANLHCNRLFAVSATDAAGNAANAVALVVGGVQTSAHIEMDSNEIIAKSNGTTKVSLWFNDSAEVTADGKVKNAVWNDYAEYRQTDTIDPGYCVATQEDGIMHITSSRMYPGAHIVSDTFGHAIGMSDTAKTPIAVAGRVLVYPYQNRNNYHIGDCVCATYDGKVDIMTREEIKEYPDRIIGIVDEIPSYEYWEQSYTFYKTKEKIKSQIKVNGRIWIYVK